MSTSWKSFVFFLAFASVANTGTAQTPAALCERSLRIGVRTDAPPFSWKVGPGQVPQDVREHCGHASGGFLASYAGYTIQLCRGYLADLASRCGEDPAPEPVEVAVEDRYDQLAASAPAFDMLCGATTATVSLGAMLPRSPYTFVTSASAIVNGRFRDGSSCRLGVVVGTSSDPETQDRVVDPRRLETWLSFIREHPHCSRDGLDQAEPFPSTLEALLALRTVEGDDGIPASEIDILIDDFHILHWYWENLEQVADRLALEAPLIEALDGLQAVDDQGRGPLRALREDLRLVPVAISIEPYAVFGPRGSGELLADFSRYLSRQQADTNGAYTALLRRCFGRQIDRSFWFLADLQSKMRDGNPLDLEHPESTDPGRQDGSQRTEPEPP